MGNSGGFAAHTQVHTKEGLKAIEEIKAGDYVLSKPVNGSEQAYKRVLQATVKPPERVIEVQYKLNKEDQAGFGVTTTLSHSFWVADLGWTVAENLYSNWLRDNVLELCDGRQAFAEGTQNIYVSDQAGIGWLPGMMGSTDGPGDLWDYVNHRLVANGVPSIDEVYNEQLANPYFKLPVYNLEVEAFHTYYVGEYGVLVQDGCQDGKPPA